MAILHKTRVKETASNKPNASTAFSLPGSAATGYRTFASAYANNDQLPYHATNGTSWESGIGTFTTGPSTLTRTTILESSNTNAAVDFSAGADVELFVEWPAAQGTLSQVANESLIPGGRLTLESGVPVSTTDQLAKTTVYYTPYLHNGITLWDGVQWRPTEFTETSIALGTLTANIGYDVFAVLSGGVLTLELSAWASATARDAGALVTLQDGRYCKDGDKTRLLLGSFYTTTATTVENSLLNRHLWNLYNRETTLAYVTNNTSHSYNPGTFTTRKWNNSTANRVTVFAGLPNLVTIALTGQIQPTSTSSGYVRVGIDSETSGSLILINTSSTTIIKGGSTVSTTLSTGFHYLQALESSDGPSVTFASFVISTTYTG